MMSRIELSDPYGHDRALLGRLWRLGLLLSGRRNVAIDLVRAACGRAGFEPRRGAAGLAGDLGCFAALLAVWTARVQPQDGRPLGDGLELGVSGDDSPAANLFAAEVLRDIRALDEPQRIAVVLAYGEGLGYRDTALVLHSDVADVAARLAGARMALAGARTALAGARTTLAGAAPATVDVLENGVTSAILTAFIDDELEPSARRALTREVEASPRLRARLGLLRLGERPFRMSLDTLLAAAPRTALDAILLGLDADDRLSADAREAATGPPPRPHRPLQRFRPRRSFGNPPDRRPMTVGASVAAMVLTLLAADDIRRFFAPEPRGPAARIASTWQGAAVAGMTLIATEDLAMRRDRLARDLPSFTLIQERLGLDLSGIADIEGLTLKRADLLRFGSTPIGELTYLSASGEFEVFCAVVDARPESPMEMTRQQGLDVWSWSRDGTSYLLAGDGGAAALRASAEAIRRKLRS